MIGGIKFEKKTLFLLKEMFEKSIEKGTLKGTLNNFMFCCLVLVLFDSSVIFNRITKNTHVSVSLSPLFL